MAFKRMIALRNKTLAHTFLPLFENQISVLSRKINFVSFHKSCYYGKLTLHFSSLLRSGYESPTLNRGNYRHIFSPLETLQNVIYSFLIRIFIVSDDVQLRRVNVFMVF